MENTKTDLTVAIEIKRQLGHKACFMLGAKKFAASNDRLTFRIGRNCNIINCIVIKLNASDLYDVTFYNIRGVNLKVVSESNGIYADMLHEVIENHTGMRTSL